MARRYTTIPIRPSTRDEARRSKRGGETWDEFVLEMVDQYDPTREESSD